MICAGVWLLVCVVLVRVVECVRRGPDAGIPEGNRCEGG